MKRKAEEEQSEESDDDADKEKSMFAVITVVTCNGKYCLYKLLPGYSLYVILFASYYHLLVILGLES